MALIVKNRTKISSSVYRVPLEHFEYLLLLDVEVVGGSCADKTGLLE